MLTYEQKLCSKKDSCEECLSWNRKCQNKNGCQFLLNSQDKSHKKMLVYDSGDMEEHNYIRVQDFAEYYLKFFDVEVKETYKDTIVFNDSIIDRYLVEFYRHGKKVDVRASGDSIQLLYKDGSIKQLDISSDFNYYSWGIRFVNHIWGIRTNYFKHFSIEMDSYREPCIRNESHIDMNVDEKGNIVIYLKNYYMPSYDKGKESREKFYILANNGNKTADEYIEALKAIAKKKYENQNAWMFEIILGDPRFKAELERQLEEMKSIKPEDYFEQQKARLDQELADITREYEEKRKKLEAERALVEQYESLTEKYSNGLVPQRALRKSLNK